MVKQAAYLKALKDYTRIKYRSDDGVETAVDDIYKESDRGAAILSATSVEDHLEWAIMQKMRPLWDDEGARNDMFGSSGTNSTFSAKILLAYSLGIIDKDARRQIDLVREIRNACAHARMPVSFDDPALAGITDVVAADYLSAMNRIPGARRHAFTLTCVGLNEYIVDGKRVPAAQAIAEASRAEAEPF
jgi:DNA-binding MltR family transcriptional regulator